MIVNQALLRLVLSFLWDSEDMCTQTDNYWHWWKAVLNLPDPTNNSALIARSDSGLMFYLNATGHADQVSVTERVRSSDSRYAGCFSSGRWLNVARLVTTPDLSRSYMVPCHSKSQDQDWRSPVHRAIGPSDYGTCLFHCIHVSYMS